MPAGIGTVAGHASPAPPMQNGPWGQRPTPGRTLSGSTSGTQMLPWVVCAPPGAAVGVVVGVGVGAAVAGSGELVAAGGAASTLVGAGAGGSALRQPAAAAVSPSTAR